MAFKRRGAVPVDPKDGVFSSVAVAPFHFCTGALLGSVGHVECRKDPMFRPYWVWDALHVAGPESLSVNPGNPLPLPTWKVYEPRS